jgi:hypothetical protein
MGRIGCKSTINVGGLARMYHDDDILFVLCRVAAHAIAGTGHLQPADHRMHAFITADAAANTGWLEFFVVSMITMIVSCSVSSTAWSCMSYGLSLWISGHALENTCMTTYECTSYHPKLLMIYTVY